jgi:hypothetical protein
MRDAQKEELVSRRRALREDIMDVLNHGCA